MNYDRINFYKDKFENYQFIAEHHTLSWKATDKNGAIISGTLNPSIINVDNIDIEIVLGGDTNLDFSNVEDCINTLRPKDKTTKKGKVIIPKNKNNN